MDGFYTIKEVQRLIGVARETLRRWEKQDSFPKRKRLSPHRRGRAGFLKSEVHAWIENRPSAA